jgi:hypothetical protein
MRFIDNVYKKTKGNIMANYRVVIEPAVTTGRMCICPNASLSGTPFEQFINQQSQDGYA